VTSTDTAPDSRAANGCAPDDRPEPVDRGWEGVVWEREPAEERDRDWHVGWGVEQDW